MAQSGTLRLVVPPGIGDLFWCYQAFIRCEGVQRIEFSVMSTSKAKTERRSEDWVPILPGAFLSPDEPFSVARNGEWLSMLRVRRRADVLAAWRKDPERRYLYALNNWLSAGRRVETTDPDLPFAREVGISIRPSLDFEVRGPYLCAYISGGTRLLGDTSGHVTWDVARWASFLDAAARKLGDLPVLLVGANYDQTAIDFVSVRLSAARRRVWRMIDAEPAVVLGAIARSRFFVCYQSGLGILADDLDVRQLFLYFPDLHQTGMPGSWPKMRNLESGVHAVGHFAETDAVLLERVT